MKLARIFTYVFNPLLMPTLGIFIMFNSGSIIDFTLPDIKRSVYLIVFLGTFVLPLSFIPFFIYNKMVKSLMMDNLRERAIPFALATISYFFVFYIISKMPVVLLLKKFVLATAIAVLIVTIVSFFWKISAHMCGIGGILGLLFAISIRLNIDVIYYTIIILFVSGIIGTCRLKLNAHKPVEIYSGFILGGTIVFLVLMYL